MIRHSWRNLGLLLALIPSTTTRFLAGGRASSSSSGAAALVLPPSPVEQISLRSRRVWVKRDDKLDLLGLGVYGNKSRKLYSFAQIPSTALPSTIVSYGGAQSNALAALAALTHKHHGKQLVYYTKPIPRWLREHPIGTYRRCLELQVEFRELSIEEYRKAFGEEADLFLRDQPPALVTANHQDGAFFVPQGGAFQAAEAGIVVLAQELGSFWEEQRRKQGGQRSLAVVLPSGTGTTALFLARHLRHLSDVHVLAVPCCGSDDYLQMQLHAIDAHSSGGQGRFPQVLPALEPSSSYHFGQPSSTLWEVYQELAKAGLRLDLLYGPRAWQVIFQHWANSATPTAAKGSLDDYSDLLYVHTGGLEGVESQLARYRRMGMSG